MKTTSTALTLLILTALLATAHAELRIWTDENGKTIEAEHVRTLTDQVVLRQADGSEIRVSLDTLSDRDRKYAILQTPPRIEISVAVDADRSNTGYGNRRSVQVQEETVTVEAKIRKSSSAPYEAPLRAELYVIGSPEQKDGYVILDKQLERFFFSTENDNQHSFDSRDIKLRQMESGRQIGVEYKGYLIAVRDKNHDVISLKCSKLEYEKNAEAIMAGKKGSIFDGDFNEFDQKDKEEMKQMNKTKKKLLPGRRF
ncbi:SHD1 domain-containing protein [Pontiellaceae bacterium B12227]|nr:SHD1 domain-containing protein [Pontiellaceae bacterium B12227]